jgi:hypothetical protein
MRNKKSWELTINWLNLKRPAVSEKRLALTPSGNIRYDVKGITSVAGTWMRRSDPAQEELFYCIKELSVGCSTSCDVKFLHVQNRK